jgi:hypothetical protein
VSGLKKEIKKFSNDWWKLTLQEAFDLHLNLESRVRVLEDEVARLSQVPTPDGFGESVTRLEAERDRLIEVKNNYFDDLETANMEITKLRARHAALVEAAQNLVNNAENKDQEEWASLPDVLALKDALAEVKG